ncbi:hypothetical protein K469DRAFT_767065, partial [Zopfia rhizophila CBS 207.26]
LLEVLPGTNVTPIECNLIHVLLDYKPKFEALSYCRGDASDLISIQCNSRRIAITRKIIAALIRLRKETEMRVIWVDILYIN